MNGERTVSNVDRTNLASGDVLVLFHGVKERKRVFASRQTDENPISTFDHVILLYSLQTAADTV